MHPKDRDRVPCSLDRAAEQPGSDITVPDHHRLHTDGTWRWFLATAVEFVILLDDVEDTSETLHGSDRLPEGFQQPFRLGHRDHVVTASAGVVVGADPGDPDAILRDADAAMYQAKESGRARIQRFDAPLRDAMLGVEALLRWHHPQRGWIPPAEFITIAEEQGLIVPVGRFVLDRALRQLRAGDGQHPNLRGLTASVNLFVHQLTEDDLPGAVSERLAQHGIHPSRLCLELTENALMQEPDAGRAVLGQLCELGVHAAIDDFGTGPSSLAYLRGLPVTTLKIDGSFMTGLGVNDRDARVITAIIVRGYFLQRPVPASAIPHLDRVQGCEAS